MASRKLDADLHLALSKADKPKALLDLTILVRQPLSPGQIQALQQLGVDADAEREVLHARGTPDTIQAIARKRGVVRVSLVRKLNLLKLRR